MFFDNESDILPDIDQYEGEFKHMGKIKTVSVFFRAVFTFCLVALPIYTAVYWLTNGRPFGPWLYITIFPYSGPILPDVGALSASAKIYSFLINMVPIAIYMTILYFLTRLFRLYQNNQIFSSENVTCIRRIGWMMLLNQLIMPLYTMMLTFTVTYDFPVGFRFIYVGFSVQNVLALLVALLIILVSWVMDEGHRLYEENSYTV